ncbi:hypothetical protein S40288_01750 [Stachybotrys chartarum IBT 40288]|nr:hypothetical protein S40288_01750 [Stachybotrys chartarum IBT 40288]
MASNNTHQPSPAIAHSPGPGTNPKRRRQPLSCEPCRHSKLRCDRRLPCETCAKRGWQDKCSYDAAQRGSLRGIRRRKTRDSTAEAVALPPVQQLVSPSEPASHRSQSPEPIHHRWDNILRRPPINQNVSATSTDVGFSLLFGPSVHINDLLARLPPDTVGEYLVSRYFASICPLFHVLHGPTFQKQYTAFLANPQQTNLSWLALLFAICSLTVRTIPATDPGLAELWQNRPMPQNLSALSQEYRNAAMMCLAQDQFLIRHNLNTLEALLVIIQIINENVGAEYAWALLGSALNIAIALRCHSDSPDISCIERERRRRCWAGILIVHSDQALLYRDTDLSHLCNMKTPMPSDANDSDILESGILTRPREASGPEPTQMSLMRFQIRLFHLLTDICNHISSADRLDEASLIRLDAAVAEEQQKWDSLYLVDGARSILDTAGYAKWCMLQAFAHQIYLLLHRPFHTTRSGQGRFRAESRDRCIKSGLALLDIHRQLCELPCLKCYRWTVKGTITYNALHGAVALTSCLLDTAHGPPSTEHIAAIDAIVHRLEKLQGCSPACASVYPILRHLQSRLACQNPPPCTDQVTVEERFDEWISNMDWFRPDDIGWNFWESESVSHQADNNLEVPT